MTATASRIAPPAQGDPTTPPKPPTVTTEGARVPPRRDHGGRFAPRATFPCCEACSWTLAESLAGSTYCANGRCAKYRQTVGAVPGVQAGTVTAAAIEVGA